MDELEAFRLNAIRQLENEQRDRDERRLKAKAEQTRSDEETAVAALALLRANEALPLDCCPRCWIWDAVAQRPIPQPSGDGPDVMLCQRCRDTWTVPR